MSASLHVERDGTVALLVMQRPPHNMLSHDQIGEIADAALDLAADTSIRCLVLAADGRSFCAGADIGGRGVGNGDEAIGGSATLELYRQGARLFDVEIPIVAAVQGPAIGGGLGLAVAADFRITCPEARFCANFAALGIHQGFALSVTLPRLIGPQRAAEMLLTAKRYKGEEAVAMGLADRLVDAGDLREEAMKFAHEIAVNAPMSIRAIKSTLRGDLAKQVRAITDHEAEVQAMLSATADAREGARAVAARRAGEFIGR